MTRIFALGETLLDIVFKNNVAITSCPGGAMLNTAVSLGRSGKCVYLISEYGKDHTGDLITQFLHDNGIHTKFVYRFDEEQTGIALAFLNQENESSYSFYKRYPDNRLAIQLPEFTAHDLLIFGSFYSVEKKLRPCIKKILEKAKGAGSLLLYDPNIRSPHKKDLPSIMDHIRENFNYADIIRGSHEDFQTILGLNTAEEVFNEMPNDKTLIYTHSNLGVWLRYLNRISFYPAGQIEIKSTIGAGDSFNAGLIYGLTKYIGHRNKLPEITNSQWNDIISIAFAFAKEVCMSYDNFIAKKS